MILVHILRDGVVLVPPFPAPKISRLLHARSILPTDYFWHEGMAEWQPVSARWEADDGATKAVALAPLAPTPAEMIATVDRVAPLPVPSRRDRTSLLAESKRRYHETLVPWATPAQAATPATG